MTCSLVKKIKCAVFSFVLNIKPLRYFSFFLQANKQNLSRDQPAPAGTSNILKQICPFCIIPHIFSCGIARLVLFFKPSTYLFHHFLFFSFLFWNPGSVLFFLYLDFCFTIVFTGARSTKTKTAERYLLGRFFGNINYLGVFSFGTFNLLGFFFFGKMLLTW